MQPTKRRSRNSTRDREKAEIAALRRLASELEAHLLAVAATRTSPRDVVTRRCRSHESATQARAWQRMAERQAQSKRVSERRNRELMMQVQRNADWIQRLWELLRETRAVRARTTSTSMLLDEMRRSTKRSDAAMLERLKLQVRAVSWHTLQQQLAAQAQAQAQGVFDGFDGFGDLSGTGNERTQTPTHTHEEDRGTDATDITHGRSGLTRVARVRQLPFDVFATASAVWAALTAMPSASAASPNSRRDECSDTHTHPGTSGLNVIERSHDACALKYRLAVPCRDTTATIQCHAVAQAIRGSDECGAKLFVWRSVSSIELESYRSDATAVDNSHSESTWFTVAVSPLSHLSSIVTLVAQSQVEFSPNTMTSANGSSNSVAISLVQEAIAAAVEQCVDAVMLSAENALVDSELARRGVRSDATGDSVWV